MISTITVFAAAFALDWMYCRWVRAIAGQRVLEAAGASMAIGACSLLGLTSIVGNHWLAAPYLLGLGAGTAWGMRP